MPESRAPFDDELELRALHIRAYGPDPDIQDDPEALARLIELEAARAESASPAPGEDAPAGPRPAAPAPAGSDERGDLGPAPEPPSSPESAASPSLARRLTSSPSRLVAVAAVVGVAVIGVIYGVATLLEPRPDAMLSPTGGTVDDLLIGLVRNSGPIDIDLSTLESFETFHGVEPWSAVDDYDNPCLILIERSTQRLVEAQCTPPEADLMADFGTWPAYEFDIGDPLPDGSIVRFHHRGDTVEAFVHPAPLR
jgi:hypothetical protein